MANRNIGTKTTAERLSGLLNTYFAKKSDIAEYTITKQGTAEEGYLATYQLFKGNTAVGDKINVPKDFLVLSLIHI